MGVPIKLTSNIYAYEEKNLMKEITTCSVKHHIQTPSISLGVLTTKSWGCEDRKPVQRLSNWLSSLVRLIIQSLPFPSLVVLLNKKLKLINLPSQRLLLMKSVKPFLFFLPFRLPYFPHSAAPSTPALTWTWLKETCRMRRSFYWCMRWSNLWFLCPTSWRTTCASLMWQWMWCRGKTRCSTSYIWPQVGL